MLDIESKKEIPFLLANPLHIHSRLIKPEQIWKIYFSCLLVCLVCVCVFVKWPIEEIFIENNSFIRKFFQCCFVIKLLKPVDLVIFSFSIFFLIGDLSLSLKSIRKYLRITQKSCKSSKSSILLVFFLNCLIESDYGGFMKWRSLWGFFL